MVCNTGVRLTPLVDGRTLHFEARGVFDGVSLIWDRETGTLWHHLTGEGLHGPLARRGLPPVANVLHTTVVAALEADPGTLVAISDRPIQRESRWAPLLERVPVLSDLFRKTIAREDTRRPTMDVGLGVWMSDSTARYFPLETVRAAGNRILDTLGGRPLQVDFDPAARALMALYPDRGGERPLQVFTRWYGWALTFPRTSIYR